MCEPLNPEGKPLMGCASENMRFIAITNRIFAPSSVFFYSNCTFLGHE